MKKLHLFVLRSYVGPLVLTFFIALFILLMQFLWKYIEDIVGKGLDTATILELLMYATASLVPMALPLAILLASLMTFGNFGETYELTALKAAGVSLQRVMFPLIILTIGTSIGAYYFSNYVLPYANLQTGSLLYDIGRKRPELNIKEGVFNYTIKGFAIKVRENNPETKMMYDFMIYDHTQSPGNLRLTTADSGMIRVSDDKLYMIINLYNGENYFEQKEKNIRRDDKEYPLEHDKFNRQQILIRLQGDSLVRTDQDLFKHHYQMMNNDQLRQSEDSINNDFDKRKNSFASNLMRSDYQTQKRRIVYRMQTFDSLKRDTMLRFMPAHMQPERDQYMLVGKDTVPLHYAPLDSLIVVANTDSIYQRMSLYDKQSVLTSAQQTIRRVMQNINTTGTHFRNVNERIRRHRIEWHRKYTLSFACFIFFFIGAPLGAIIRKGGLGVPVVISVVFFIFYYVVSLFGDKVAREGILEPWQGMWIASAILLPVGAWLTYKSTTDSNLFNIDQYRYTIERFFKRFGIKLWKEDEQKIAHKRWQEPLDKNQDLN